MTSIQTPTKEHVFALLDDFLKNTPTHLLPHLTQRVERAYAERNQSELLNWVNGNEAMTIRIENYPEPDDNGEYFDCFTYTIKTTDKSFSFTDSDIDDLDYFLDQLTDNDDLFDMILFPDEAMPYIYAIQAGIAPSNIHETDEATKSEQALTSHLSRIFQLIAGCFIQGGATRISLSKS